MKPNRFWNKTVLTITFIGAHSFMSNIRSTCIECICNRIAVNVNKVNDQWKQRTQNSSSSTRQHLSQCMCVWKISRARESNWLFFYHCFVVCAHHWLLFFVRSFVHPFDFVACHGSLTYYNVYERAFAVCVFVMMCSISETLWCRPMFNHIWTTMMTATATATTTMHQLV